MKGHTTMKTIMPVAFAALANIAFALTERVGGITWTYTVTNGVAWLGEESVSSPAVSKNTTGAISIPASLGGYPVTQITRGAFCGCNQLTVSDQSPASLLPSEGRDAVIGGEERGAS